ncbi:MAG TPA: GNAT family N-acetyltransferase [Fimbriimonadaceae bacterium]|nr:GNAT family N-acetyltransferase [Fimbriimonadaceae bacterium]
MRISFRDADWDALARLWADFYPERYHVDANLLRINTVESPVFDWGASAIEVMDDETLGFVIVKRPATPMLWKGPNQDTYHIGAIAYREPETGVDLMTQAKRAVADRGAMQLLFGMDSRHFFPGCPEDCHNLCSFLMVEGFEKTGGHFDLERDLGDYVMPVEPAAGVEYRMASESDLQSLKAFFEEEFPGRWRHDVLEKISVEGADKTCFGAFEGKRAVGFALIQDWTHRQPIGGAVWHQALGEKWGALGPIGVAESERGRGLGHSVLGMALSNLKSRGVRNCIIDWTTLEEFYGRHGFQISRRYKAASLRLD